MPSENIHFVTGRLAEPLLRNVLADLAPRAGFAYSVEVLGISVAALMTPPWVAPRVHIPPGATRVVLPGYCHGDLNAIAQSAGITVERGPRDLRDLPEFFGQRVGRENYGAYDIEILAEINHAPRLSRQQILDEARRLHASGADIIDVGCNPDETWTGVGEIVGALRDENLRVSIDSLNPVEIAAAARAGAELVLSVNASNREQAGDWGIEVVAIPDTPGDWVGLEATLERLEAQRVRYRVDPVLEPIGFGFAASLGRYLEARRRWPKIEILMGVGNLTELTEVDSAGVNVLLLGFCQELGIRSILTTEVINWARTAIRECDIARRLVHYAQVERALPKHIDPRLVMLRDTKVHRFSAEELASLAATIKDHNVRLFAQDGRLHLIAAGMHLQATDPFDLFTELQTLGLKNLDPSHAFYLGYELSKAVTSLTLGKEYRQDQSLDWGMLTQSEVSHRAAKGRRPASDPSSEEQEPGS
jgi:dihydropteroate synthase-like protein